jgi:hypothetical protein
LGISSQQQLKLAGVFALLQRWDGACGGFVYMYSTAAVQCAIVISKMKAVALAVAKAGQCSVRVLLMKV